MENEGKNIIDQKESQAQGVHSDVSDGNAAPSMRVSKKRRPLIKSIPMSTTINYCLFALIVLILFYLVSFAGLYIVYGSLMENDAKRIERSASAGFPKRVDDNSLVLIYKRRLVEIARSNKPVAIAVFETDSSGHDVCLLVDDMGNGISDNSDLFDYVMDELDFTDVFERGKVRKASTPFGTYLCKGSKQVTENGTVYLLIMKPYDIWSNQVIKIVYVLIVCTIIVLALACVFAFFASRHETKHLKDFSQKAKRLAEGDYNVEFSGYGYNEYENLACALNAATQNIQKAENLQRDIVANVSHDIRTPLTMIRAYAEMLRDMPLNESKREKTANVIITEADRLNSLVSDVLDYSRMQAGVTEYKFEPCDLSETALSVIDRFEPVCERDGIKLVREIDDNATVTCDRAKIEQVFYNLLGNAVNYCGDDQTVILRVKNQDTCVRVEVTDHGSGIEQENLDLVWDRYYRSPHATRRVVGTGLGLSICKSVLTAHDATFGVVSEIGKGSTFWFELTIQN
ncbi:MAG: HAMP domain-containing histidine kinase [Clostridiales bacterium]|nr:HAMP domain-containing histidine kinase [Clostridiales bacterium]